MLKRSGPSVIYGICKQKLLTCKPYCTMVYKNHFYCRVYIFISKHPPNDTGQDRMNISVQHEFSRTVEKLLKNK